MKRRRWRAIEIRLLCERYTIEGPRLLAAQFGRSVDSVTSFARRIRLTTPRRSYQRRSRRKSARCHPADDLH